MSRRSDRWSPASVPARSCATPRAIRALPRAPPRKPGRPARGPELRVDPRDARTRAPVADGLDVDAALDSGAVSSSSPRTDALSGTRWRNASTTPSMLLRTRFAHWLATATEPRGRPAMRFPARRRLQLRQYAPAGTARRAAARATTNVFSTSISTPYSRRFTARRTHATPRQPRQRPAAAAPRGDQRHSSRSLEDMRSFYRGRARDWSTCCCRASTSHNLIAVLRARPARTSGSRTRSIALTPVGWLRSRLRAGGPAAS